MWSQMNWDKNCAKNVENVASEMLEARIQKASSWRCIEKRRSMAVYGAVSRTPCTTDTLCGRLDNTLRSRPGMLAARATTIKVVSVDRDVTLPVACRSTFIAVIQPRIERPTAERRNGNTQRFSCKPTRTRSIATPGREVFLLDFWTP